MVGRVGRKIEERVDAVICRRRGTLGGVRRKLLFISSLVTVHKLGNLFNFLMIEKNKFNTVYKTYERIVPSLCYLTSA